MAELEPGASAPDFTLPALDGSEISLRELRTKGPVLLIFLKTDCATCDLAWPYYQRLYESYPSDGWSLLAVSQSTPDETRAFVQQHNARFPHVIDAEGYPVSHAYDPLATPTVYVINRDGKIEQVLTGFAKDDLNALSQRAAAWTGQEPIEIAPADDGNPAWRPGCVAGHLTMEEVMARTRQQHRR